MLPVPAEIRFEIQDHSKEIVITIITGVAAFLSGKFWPYLVQKWKNDRDNKADELKRLKEQVEKLQKENANLQHDLGEANGIISTIEKYVITDGNDK